MKPGLHGRRRDRQQRGRFSRVPLFEFSKSQDTLVGFGEGGDRVADVLREFMTFKLIVCAFRVARGKRGRREWIQALLGLSAPRAQLHQTGVDDDAMKPGRHLRLALKAIDRSMGCQKSFLDRIARILFFAEKATGNRMHPLSMGLHEIFEGALFAILESGNEVGFPRKIELSRPSGAALKVSIDIRGRREIGLMIPVPVRVGIDMEKAVGCLQVHRLLSLSSTAERREWACESLEMHPLCQEPNLPLSVCNRMV